MSLAPKAKGVKYTTLLLIVVGVFFLIPGILYILEGGPLIALLPLFLTLVSMITSIGLYLLKKWAWIAAIIIGFVGTIIFVADWVNINIESYLGGIFCIILLIALVMNRRYYI
ncbi:MAG: hypothetical protein JSV09_10965 [Thermoplasmata archaeon]|nr:MAG: hypothetical protein JSV09_10965 [Thermoplasmata archaeon]